MSSNKRITGPLFKWFGSKWLSAAKLPPPRFGLIFEPFAGSAGYSLRHADRQVVLWESNPQLLELWHWLCKEAMPDDIMAIPLGIPEGTDIRTLGLSRGQQLLLKHWQRTNNVGDCWTISPWGNKPGQWTASTRARVAREIQYVAHWQIAPPAWGPESTYLIDPPYWFNYRYRQPPIDYETLAANCLTAAACGGQVIACEARCPKTGTAPAWLPFTDWASRITSRRTVDCHHHSREMIWLGGPQ